MAEPIRGTLTGFTSAMSRHGARVVPHDDATLLSHKATAISREHRSPFAIVDGVKVYVQCVRDAQDYAIRRLPIPVEMQYVEGESYKAVVAAPTAEKIAQTEIDALIAAVANPGAATAPLPVAAAVEAPPGASAELARRCAELQQQNAALAERLKTVQAELVAVRAMAPATAENSVSVEIPGFGSIELVVDYLYQQDKILVLGVLKSKKRAQAIPKPQGENTNVTFAATIQGKRYELVAFGDLRFPVGDLDVQAFIITSVKM